MPVPVTAGVVPIAGPAAITTGWGNPDEEFTAKGEHRAPPRRPAFGPGLDAPDYPGNPLEESIGFIELLYGEGFLDAGKEPKHVAAAHPAGLDRAVLPTAE